MANRKDLKKAINYIAGELFTECIICSLNLSEEGKQKADKVMTDILNMQNEFISRISHTEPGNVKGFYKKLKSDFNTQIEEVFNKLNEK